MCVCVCVSICQLASLAKIPNPRTAFVAQGYVPVHNTWIKLH